MLLIWKILSYINIDNNNHDNNNDNNNNANDNDNNNIIIIFQTSITCSIFNSIYTQYKYAMKIKYVIVRIKMKSCFSYRI